VRVRHFHFLDAFYSPVQHRWYLLLREIWPPANACHALHRFAKHVQHQPPRLKAAAACLIRRRVKKEPATSRKQPVRRARSTVGEPCRRTSQFSFAGVNVTLVGRF